MRCGNYSNAVKLIDLVLQQARRDSSACVTQLLCNRAYCYHQLGLLRKAVKACRPNLAHGCTALALIALLFLQVLTVETSAKTNGVEHSAWSRHACALVVTSKPPFTQTC